MKILLRREEVNPEKLDTDRRTPLSHAAKGGRLEVVEILLGREEVSPDKQGNDGEGGTSAATVSQSGNLQSDLRLRNTPLWAWPPPLPFRSMLFMVSALGHRPPSIGEIP